MNESYIATEQDVEVIKQVLTFLKRSELDFIFKNRRLLDNTELVTYDSKFAYVIQQNGTFKKFAHGVQLSRTDKLGWRASISIPEIRRELSNDINYISGPVQSIFIKSHQQRENKSIYTTTESYGATIIHEFGHVYYENIKNSWFSNYDYNVKLMNIAKDLYNGKETNLENFEIRLPRHLIESETFAFCTEYSAAKYFWPEYKKQLDSTGLETIDRYLNQETSDKLKNEESVLDESHVGAYVIGKILMEKLGDKWVDFILDKKA
ncbi:hypothetical protein C4561_04515 [candidate division WWE3 bacterium]|jgi:hypothetical protein|uniref:Uncharacterized protein n=1 Tax=candidate division WWE3 bacterium TaxID=2053526 RepID=A0A3A4ZCR6_UNCKA|nr:MAG: hypothetical protein C4561_04515 [candidate division WWE3 bacterium]